MNLSELKLIEFVTTPINIAEHDSIDCTQNCTVCY